MREKTAFRIRATAERDVQQNVEHLIINQEELAGHLWNNLREHEPLLTRHYRGLINFAPDGKCNYIVRLTGAGDHD